MKIVYLLVLLIIALLSIAAGLAKVMQAPQEMEFLQGLGLSPLLIMIFGLAQIAGGLLLGPTKTRLAGAVLVTLAFALSAVLLVLAGNVPFALISVIPVLLAAFIVYQAKKASPE